MDNLSQTTKIVSFLATNGNFIMKSTTRCVHSFLEPCSTSTFLLTLLSCSSFFDIYYNPPHIFPYLLLLLATNNSLLLILSSSTFPHVLLLVYHNVTRLFLLSTLHPSVHRFFPLLTLDLPLLATLLLSILLLLPSSSFLLL